MNPVDPFRKDLGQDEMAMATTIGEISHNAESAASASRASAETANRNRPVQQGPIRRRQPGPPRSANSGGLHRPLESGCRRSKALAGACPH